MFSVLDRYLMTEISKTMLAIFLVLVLIVSAHNFILYLERGSAGTLSHDLIFTMIGLELSKEMGLLITPTFFFAVLMTLSRLYRDSEMTALFAGGVGPWRVFRGYVWLVLPVMLISGTMTLWTKPWANKELKTYKNQEEQRSDMVNVGAGKFNESTKGDLIFYVEELNEDRTLMRNLFVQHRDGGDLAVIRSKDGYQYTDTKTGDTYVVLQNGFRYDGEPGDYQFRLARFVKYGVRIAEGNPDELNLEPKTRSTPELLASGQLADMVELQLRLSGPLAVLIFAVLSIPLSRASPRQGMAGRMVLALLAYFLFSNLEAVSGNWMLKGTTPYWLGRWWVHLLMLGLAGLLMVLDSLWFAQKRRQFWLQLRPAPGRQAAQ